MIGVNLSEELQRIRKIMNLDEQVKHIFQPTGHSCGPTCIKMVGDFIKGDVGKIEDICQSCGTDFVVGTPPDKMKKGLNSLGIKYVEHISEKEPFQSIKNTIDKGNVAIVRTITRDVPHWIVIVAYDGDVFDVHDPWLGQIKYNEKKLGNIWKVRDFFYFEILASQPKTANDITIRKMTDADVKAIMPNLSKIFIRTGLSNAQIWEEIGEYNHNMSIVAEVQWPVGGILFLWGSSDSPESQES